MTRVGWPWDTTPSKRTWRNQEEKNSEGLGIPQDDLSLLELCGAGAWGQEQSSRERVRPPPHRSAGHRKESNRGRQGSKPSAVAESTGAALGVLSVPVRCSLTTW